MPVGIGTASAARTIAWLGEAAVIDHGHDRIAGFDASPSPGPISSTVPASSRPGVKGQLRLLLILAGDHQRIGEVPARRTRPAP